MFFSTDVDPNILMNILRAVWPRSLRNDCGEISRVIVVWRGHGTSPVSYRYDLLLPPCEIAPACPSTPLRYYCYESGHVAEQCDRPT